MCLMVWRAVVRMHRCLLLVSQPVNSSGEINLPSSLKARTAQKHCMGQVQVSRPNPGCCCSQIEKRKSSSGGRMFPLARKTIRKQERVSFCVSVSGISYKGGCCSKHRIVTMVKV